MLVAGCLLAIAIFGSTNAQTFSMGNCNPNIKTMKNYDKNQLTGKWYEIKRSHIIAREGTKCFIITFETVKRDMYNMKTTFVFKCHDSQVQSVQYTVDTQDLGSGKMKFIPGFISDEQPFVILDTDYNKYSIVYSCMDSYEGKIEFAWIHSKNPHPDNAIIAEAEEVLKKHNINVKLINEEQNCE